MSRSGFRETRRSAPRWVHFVMDVGLLLTMLIVVGGVQFALRAVPPSSVDRTQLLEVIATPMVVGLIAARVVYVVLDHPASALRIRDLMVVRSGMEFWAGVTVGLAWVLVRAHRTGRRAEAVVMLAAAVPYLLLGVALYEASCIVRDGCLGPVARVGMIPHGLHSPMVPVGLLVAAVLLGAAVVLRQAWTLEADQTVVCSLVVLGGVRLVASWFLPALGPSRVERESAVVFVLAMIGLVVVTARRRSARATTSESTATTSGTNNHDADEPTR